MRAALRRREAVEGDGSTAKDCGGWGRFVEVMEGPGSRGRLRAVAVHPRRPSRGIHCQMAHCRGLQRVPRLAGHSVTGCTFEGCVATCRTAEVAVG